MPKRLVILLLTLLMISVHGAFAGSTDTLHTTYVVNSDYVPMHVVQISVGGGLHTLMPKTTDAAANILAVDDQTPAVLRKGLGAGAQVQATYTYFFHKYVGVTAGIGFDMYTGNMNGSFKDRVQLYYKDPSHAPAPQKEMTYWLNSDYKNFKEREQIYMLTVPVGITGRVSLTDPIQLRGTLGFGMNIIAGSHFRGEGELTTTGDFPTLSLHIDPDLPQHGFSNYYMGGYKGKIENTFPVNMFIFGDFGMHYQFTRRWGLYAGLYLNYTCFNAVRPTTNEAGNRPELVTFDMKTRQFTYSGIINSKFVEALHPLSFGVKVGVTITYLDPIKCNCEDW